MNGEDDPAEGHVLPDDLEEAAGEAAPYESDEGTDPFVTMDALEALDEYGRASALVEALGISQTVLHEARYRYLGRPRVVLRPDGFHLRLPCFEAGPEDIPRLTVSAGGRELQLGTMRSHLLGGCTVTEPVDVNLTAQGLTPFGDLLTRIAGVDSWVHSRLRFSVGEDGVLGVVESGESTVCMDVSLSNWTRDLEVLEAPTVRFGAVFFRALVDDWSRIVCLRVDGGLSRPQVTGRRITVLPRCEDAELEDGYPVAGDPLFGPKSAIYLRRIDRFMDRNPRGRGDAGFPTLRSFDIRLTRSGFHLVIPPVICDDKNPEVVLECDGRRFALPRVDVFRHRGVLIRRQQTVHLTEMGLSPLGGVAVEVDGSTLYRNRGGEMFFTIRGKHVGMPYGDGFIATKTGAPIRFSGAVVCESEPFGAVTLHRVYIPMGVLRGMLASRGYTEVVPGNADGHPPSQGPAASERADEWPTEWLPPLANHRRTDRAVAGRRAAANDAGAGRGKGPRLRSSSAVPADISTMSLEDLSDDSDREDAEAVRDAVLEADPSASEPHLPRRRFLLDPPSMLVRDGRIRIAMAAWEGAPDDRLEFVLRQSSDAVRVSARPPSFVLGGCLCTGRFEVDPAHMGLDPFGGIAIEIDGRGAHRMPASDCLVLPDAADPSRLLACVRSGFRPFVGGIPLPAPSEGCGFIFAPLVDPSAEVVSVEVRPGGGRSGGGPDDPLRFRLSYGDLTITVPPCRCGPDDPLALTLVSGGRRIALGALQRDASGEMTRARRVPLTPLGVMPWDRFSMSLDGGVIYRHRPVGSMTFDAHGRRVYDGVGELALAYPRGVSLRMRGCEVNGVTTRGQMRIVRLTAGRDSVFTVTDEPVGREEEIYLDGFSEPQADRQDDAGGSVLLGEPALRIADFRLCLELPACRTSGAGAPSVLLEAGSGPVDPGSLWPEGPEDRVLGAVSIDLTSLGITPLDGFRLLLDGAQAFIREPSPVALFDDDGYAASSLEGGVILAVPSGAVPRGHGFDVLSEVDACGVRLIRVNAEPGCSLYLEDRATGPADDVSSEGAKEGPSSLEGGGADPPHPDDPVPVEAAAGVHVPEGPCGPPEPEDDDAQSSEPFAGGFGGEVLPEDQGTEEAPAGQATAPLTGPDPCICNDDPLPEVDWALPGCSEPGTDGNSDTDEADGLAHGPSSAHQISDMAKRARMASEGAREFPMGRRPSIRLDGESLVLRVPKYRGEEGDPMRLSLESCGREVLSADLVWDASWGRPVSEQTDIDITSVVGSLFGGLTVLIDGKAVHAFPQSDIIIFDSTGSMAEACLGRVKVFVPEGMSLAGVRVESQSSIPGARVFQAFAFGDSQPVAVEAPADSPSEQEAERADPLPEAHGGEEPPPVAEESQGDGAPASDGSPAPSAQDLWPPSEPRMSAGAGRLFYAEGRVYVALPPFKAPAWGARGIRAVLADGTSTEVPLAASGYPPAYRAVAVDTVAAGALPWEDFRIEVDGCEVYRHRGRGFIAFDDRGRPTTTFMGDVAVVYPSQGSIVFKHSEVRRTFRHGPARSVEASLGNRGSFWVSGDPPDEGQLAGLDALEGAPVSRRASSARMRYSGGSLSVEIPPSCGLSEADFKVTVESGGAALASGFLPHPPDGAGPSPPVTIDIGRLGIGPLDGFSVTVGQREVLRREPAGIALFDMAGFLTDAPVGAAVAVHPAGTDLRGGGFKVLSTKGEGTLESSIMTVRGCVVRAVNPEPEQASEPGPAPGPAAVEVCDGEPAIPASDAPCPPEAVSPQAAWEAPPDCEMGDAARFRMKTEVPRQFLYGRRPALVYIDGTVLLRIPRYRGEVGDPLEAILRCGAAVNAIGPLPCDRSWGRPVSEQTDIDLTARGLSPCRGLELSIDGAVVHRRGTGIVAFDSLGTEPPTLIGRLTVIVPAGKALDGGGFDILSERGAGADTAVTAMVRDPDDMRLREAVDDDAWMWVSPEPGRASAGRREDVRESPPPIPRDQLHRFRGNADPSLVLSGSRVSIRIPPYVGEDGDRFEAVVTQGDFVSAAARLNSRPFRGARVTDEMDYFLPLSLLESGSDAWLEIDGRRMRRFRVHPVLYFDEGGRQSTSPADGAFRAVYRHGVQVSRRGVTVSGRDILDGMVIESFACGPSGGRILVHDRPAVAEPSRRRFADELPDVSYDPSSGSFHLSIPAYAFSPGDRLQASLVLADRVLPLPPLAADPHRPGPVTRPARVDITSLGVSPLERMRLMIDDRMVHVGWESRIMIADASGRRCIRPVGRGFIVCGSGGLPRTNGVGFGRSRACGDVTVHETDFGPDSVVNVGRGVVIGAWDESEAPAVSESPASAEITMPSPVRGITAFSSNGMLEYHREGPYVRVDVRGVPAEECRVTLSSKTPILGPLTVTRGVMDLRTSIRRGRLRVTVTHGDAVIGSRDFMFDSSLSLDLPRGLPGAGSSIGGTMCGRPFSAPLDEGIRWSFEDRGVRTSVRWDVPVCYIEEGGTRRLPSHRDVRADGLPDSMEVISHGIRRCRMRYALDGEGFAEVPSSWDGETLRADLASVKAAMEATPGTHSVYLVADSLPAFHLFTVRGATSPEPAR